VLSQNFLMDMNLTRKIVRKAGVKNDDIVVEIGPGPGGITRALLEKDTKRVDVVELDDRFLPTLEHLQSHSKGRLHIHSADILKTDIGQIWRDAEVPIRPWHDKSLPPLNIIGNLPFNIASPLIIKFLKQMSRREGPWAFGRVPLTLTFQKEVAQRILSDIDSVHRSRLSVMSQFVSKPKLLFEMSGRCFVPPPEIDVGVVRFEPRIEPLIPAAFELVEKVVRHVFIYRRKQIFKCIRTLYPNDRWEEMANDLLRACRISPDSICVNISNEEIADVCLYYKKQCEQMPGLFAFKAEHQSERPEQLLDKPNAMPPQYLFGPSASMEEGVPLCDFDEAYAGQLGIKA